MENKTKQNRRTADQILFAEYEKFEQKKRALRKLEKLLTRFDKLKAEVVAARDELEALGMTRLEIVKAFDGDAVTTKLLKAASDTPATSESLASPAELKTPASPATPASDEDEDETASDRPPQNW